MTYLEMAHALEYPKEDKSAYDVAVMITIGILKSIPALEERIAKTEGAGEYECGLRNGMRLALHELTGRIDLEFEDCVPYMDNPGANVGETACNDAVSRRAAINAIYTSYFCTDAAVKVRCLPSVTTPVPEGGAE